MCAPSYSGGGAASSCEDCHQMNRTSGRLSATVWLLGFLSACGGDTLQKDHATTLPDSGVRLPSLSLVFTSTELDASPQNLNAPAVGEDGALAFNADRDQALRLVLVDTA